jgi:hypothetical protein
MDQQSTGKMLSQILLQRVMVKDKQCILSRLTPVKVNFISLIGKHLGANTPSPLEGEDCREFLLHWSQHFVSVKELLGGNKPHNKKKQKTEHDVHPQQHELEHKKWEMDVAFALMDEMKRNLPESPGNDEEQSEDHQLLSEHEASK